MDSHFDALGLEATRLGAIGDCNVELGDYDGAISYFNKSVSFSDNEFTAPIYLKKAGLAYEKLGDNGKALSTYRRIQTFHWEYSLLLFRTMPRSNQALSLSNRDL